MHPLEDCHTPGILLRHLIVLRIYHLLSISEMEGHSVYLNGATAMTLLPRIYTECYPKIKH